MIELLSGRPGGGKSLYAMRRIVEYLSMYPRRQVVTNLEINEDALLSDGIDTERIVFLRPIGETDDATLRHYTGRKGLDALRYFFLVRHSEFVALLWGKDEEIDWSPIYESRPDYEGTLYVIDEVHKLYPARGFRDFDQRIATYFAEHRHLGDDVLLICQFPRQVDSQVRNLVQNHIVCDNLENRRIGVFRGDRRFRVKTYANDPTGQPSAVPDLTVKYPVDPRYFRYYRSSRAGASGDFTRKRKGVSYKWFKVAIPASVVLLALGSWAATRFVGGFAEGMVGDTMASVLPDRGDVPPSVASEFSRGESVDTSAEGAREGDAPGDDRVVGYVVRSSDRRGLVTYERGGTYPAVFGRSGEVIVRSDRLVADPRSRSIVVLGGLLGSMLGRERDVDRVDVDEFFRGQDE